jgi:hypothetical protein
VLGVREGVERRTGDLDRAGARIEERSPRCKKAATPVEAGTVRTSKCDDERNVSAARAPYVHVLDGLVELQSRQPY